MNDPIIELARSAHAISLIDLAYSLVLSIALGMIIVVVYRITHRGFHYERSFLTTLLMICPIVAVVMMLIGSNLALSLGMVGALSIIRFRTVIKDSRDMVYLFLAIAVGLGCGTYNWLVVGIAVTFLCGVLLVLNLFKLGKPMHADYVLILSGESAVPPEEGALKQEMQQHTRFLETRSINIDEEHWEIVFEARLPKGKSFPDAALYERLKKGHGVKKLSLLSPQLSLPV
ncbi:MAG: DUF4956 domain-containing protein [Verrucomicrobiales bacterium]|nr:DUF4956 domain-containing protein [Verrucomicrobiales bacterium]